MANRGGKLGDTYVDIHGNPDSLNRTLDETKARVESDTEQMGTAAEKNIGGGFKKAGERVGESTAEVGKLREAITATVSKVTSLVGALASTLGLLKIIEKSVDYIRGQGQRIGGLLPEVEARLKATAAELENGRKITAAEVDLNAKLVALAAAKEETERRGNVFATNRSKELAFQAGVDVGAYTTKSEQLKLLQRETDLTTSQLRQLQQRLRLEYQISQEQERRNDIPDLFVGDARKRADEYAAHIKKIRAEDAADARRVAEEEAAWLMSLYEEVGKMQEARIKANLALLDKVTSAQASGINNLSGTIETLADRMEAVVEATAFASTRRKS